MTLTLGTNLHIFGPLPPSINVDPNEGSIIGLHIRKSEFPDLALHGDVLSFKNFTPCCFSPSGAHWYKNIRDTLLGIAL